MLINLGHNSRIKNDTLKKACVNNFHTAENNFKPFEIEDFANFESV